MGVKGRFYVNPDNGCPGFKQNKKFWTEVLNTPNLVLDWIRDSYKLSLQFMPKAITSQHSSTLGTPRMGGSE